MNQITPLSVLWAEPNYSSLQVPAARPLSMHSIAKAVAAHYGLTLEDLKGPSRKKCFSRPRQEAMALMCAVGRYSLPQIGQFLGGRDHTTVLHGKRAYAKRQAEAGQP
jgi:chromosomal replication initiator protein